MSSACIIQFVCTATSLCTLSYIVIYIEMSFFRLCHVFSLLTSITIETLLICYASEQVTHEGGQMAIAIYDTNWIDQPVRFRRTLVLMLMRSQRPICIVAGNILPVRMTTLLSVGRVYCMRAEGLGDLLRFERRRTEGTNRRVDGHTYGQEDERADRRRDR